MYHGGLAVDCVVPRAHDVLLETNTSIITMRGSNGVALLASLTSVVLGQSGMLNNANFDFLTEYPVTNMHGSNPGRWYQLHLDW